jgi:predicted RNA-binding protein with PIN domain
LLVDGYNIIFAWDELKKIAEKDLEAARNRLTDILCNYRGYKQCELILVFDAYKVKGNDREIEKINNISVVYTKEAETADMYIEKVTRELGKKHRVRVATSDGTEQIIILGSGAYRMSAAELYEDVKRVEKEIMEYLKR